MAAQMGLASYLKRGEPCSSAPILVGEYPRFISTITKSKLTIFSLPRSRTAVLGHKVRLWLVGLTIPGYRGYGNTAWAGQDEDFPRIRPRAVRLVSFHYHHCTIRLTNNRFVLNMRVARCKELRAFLKVDFTIYESFHTHQGVIGCGRNAQVRMPNGSLSLDGPSWTVQVTVHRG